MAQMMRVERASWSAPNNVHALTTTIDGGVSQGVYKGLNLGGHVGDEVAKVIENRKLLHDSLALPSQPYWLNQVHGVEVVLVDECSLIGQGESLPAEGSPLAEGSPRAEGSLSLPEGSLPLAEGSNSYRVPDADGVYTFSKEVVCAILTADCMPLFITSRSGDQVALLHAGWRGLAGGIIERGVAALKCSPEDMVVWAGPCIGPTAFEVGDEVRQCIGGADKAYVPSKKSQVGEEKWLANLYLLAGERFAKLGVEHYFFSQCCTFSDPQFYSYRRDGQCGRMASLIWFE